MARLIVEVLDGRGTVRERVAIGALPAMIGRGYGNDVIIDDPYVCPSHARLLIDDAGSIVVEDAGSVNGVRLDGRGERVPSATLRSGDRIRVGRTLLRVLDAGHGVPPTLVERQTSRLTRLAESGRARIAASIVAVVFFAGSAFLGSYERTAYADALQAGVGVMLLLVLWSAIWALVGRVVVHRASFLGHLAVASTAAILMLVLGVAGEWASFLFPDGPLDTLFGTVTGFALFALLVFGHLSLATGMNVGARARTTAVVTAVGIALFGLSSLADHEEFSTEMSYPGTLKPLAARWIPAVTLERFVDEAAGLRGEVDALARDDTSTTAEEYLELSTPEGADKDEGRDR